jgi:hypothetical protein
MERLAVFLEDFLAGRLAFVDFFAAFFAAGLAFRAAFLLAAGACFFLVGARFTAATGLTGAGIAGVAVMAVVDGTAGLAGMAGVAAGILIASSQPGVNISNRSREMAFARPQRGHRAS